MPTERKVTNQDYHIIDTKLTHSTIRKKVLKDDFARIRGALVNTEMYSTIPVSNEF